MANRPIRPGPRNVLGRSIATHSPSLRKDSQTSSAAALARL
nr:hypothetical protein [Amycolatopsis kentuckyensis]